MVGTGLHTPWDDHYMLPAFLGCVSWALTEPKMMERFQEKTGHRLDAPRSPIDRMIDKATGHDVAVLQDFIDWVADEVFGRPENLDDPQ